MNRYVAVVGDLEINCGGGGERSRLTTVVFVACAQEWRMKAPVRRCCCCPCYPSLRNAVPKGLCRLGGFSVWWNRYNSVVNRKKSGTMQFKSTIDAGDCPIYRPPPRLVRGTRWRRRRRRTIGAFWLNFHNSQMAFVGSTKKATTTSTNTRQCKMKDTKNTIY